MLWKTKEVENKDVVGDSEMRERRLVSLDVKVLSRQSTTLDKLVR